jgi:hypothetical protein
MNDKSALAQAITLTDEILRVLENGEFERISELEVQRKSYIEQIFTESLEQIDLIKARHLQNLNQQVVDKLNLFKNAIVLRQADVRNAVKATRAYLDHDSVPK